MPLNVNSISSGNYVQVIQSAKNRQRIDEQQQQIQKENDVVIASFVQERLVAAQLPSDISAASARHEMYVAYDTAKKQHNDFKSQQNEKQQIDLKTQAQLGAYETVSNQENRDNLQKMLGISIYV